MLRNRCLNDPGLQCLLNLHYAKNCKAWIRDWGITFDPRRKAARLMPFMLFPRQEQFVDFVLGCYRDKENGLTEKCRDVGATWLACDISTWLWLYEPGAVVGWGSRLVEYVDKTGDPKAIFTKIRQQMNMIPRWMMPQRWNPLRHSTHMRILNPDTDAAITGEGGDNMGRGGRTSLYFKDESAHYEHPELVEAALGDNTDVQIDMSSVNGSNNVFYRKRQAGEVWYPDAQMTIGKTRVFIFDWSDHPAKTQEWHDKRERAAIDIGLLHIFRQEVDRDYAGSIENIIIRPEWVDASVDAHLALGFGDDGMRTAGQDVADGGADKNAIVVAKGVVIRYCHQWGGEAGEAAKLALPVCVQYGVDELYYDSIGVGSGFKTEINTQRALPSYPHRLRVFPWNAGAAVLDPDDNIIPNDDESPTNADQYVNLKAQSWFRVRARFYKTYRAVKFMEKYPPDELISLDSTMPMLHELKMQLSQATYKSNGVGKTLVDKKPEGASSPNLADAAVICFNPTRELSIFDVL